MKSLVYSTLGLALAVGVLSGCSGSDGVPIVTPSGPTASADDQRTPQSDALTSDEAALISQAESEPIPAPLPDL
ncbi:hypothetical protein [Nitrospira sp. BLG_2]|uniref:hypothetical protein n=1 Tax=Nitrospira sp. BLG_2 TaxID=3397507 RepID=UPI003B9A7D6A